MSNDYDRGGKLNDRGKARLLTGEKARTKLDAIARICDEWESSLSSGGQEPLSLAAMMDIRAVLKGEVTAPAAPTVEPIELGDRFEHIEPRVRVFVVSKRMNRAPACWELREVGTSDHMLVLDESLRDSNEWRKLPPAVPKEEVTGG